LKCLGDSSGLVQELSEEGGFTGGPETPKTRSASKQQVFECMRKRRLVFLGKNEGEESLFPREPPDTLLQSKLAVLQHEGGLKTTYGM
jgi:hypothetical protein